jgi:hypothetical protein
MGRRLLRDLDAFSWMKLVIVAQLLVIMAGFASWQIRDIPTRYRSSAISLLLSDFRPVLDTEMLNKEIGASQVSLPPEPDDLDLTLVMASRNDGYGGKTSHARAQLALDMIDYHLGVYPLKVELVLVEWSPSPDAKPYHEVFRLPKNVASIRFVVVPSVVHELWTRPLMHSNYSFVPFHEFIAKNIGIRRARGRYVMGHAMDTILADGFWKMMANRELEKIEKQYNKPVLFRAVRVETADDGTSYELKVAFFVLFFLVFFV